MKKKFFLHKTVDALTEKQVTDLNNVFGGLSQGSVDASGLVYDDDIIYIPTGGGGPRCPWGYYWHEGVQRCIKDGTYPELPHDHAHVRLG
ncbi:hypothetical protein [Kordia sp.]|uniref:hypothetical protein n=1 Tax=Kordia sp. TaxID=1965332 RepID=UPI003D2A50D2